MVSARLLSLVSCPGCGAPLRSEERQLRCTACDAAYQVLDDFVDLRPLEHFGEQTRYLDETLHADARHLTVSPPLLSAAVRQRMLLKFLQPAAGDRVLDLGCGSGRVLVWNRARGAYQAGIDASPFFATEARQSIDLALGDLRRLPFSDGAFTKAYALDVFEHLSREGLGRVLDETWRVLAPEGALFVYSHVRKNGWPAIGLRAINAFGRMLERLGLLDLTQERLRKSDHVNPLADIPDLEAVIGAAGFRVQRVRYYTPLLAGFVENVVMRMVERRMVRRATRKAEEARKDLEPGDARLEAARVARAEAKARVARQGATYVLLRWLSWLMRLDVVVWGRIRSGPFFALLVKTARPEPGVAEAR